MKKKLMVTLLAVFGIMPVVSAQTTGSGTTGDNIHDPEFHPPHRGSQTNSEPQVSYNSASTVLNVSFPTDGQGGKIEIYCDGSLIVSENAAAGTSLCYLLRKYGNGEYVIIVSSGNTVVYSNSLTIR